MRTCIAVIGFVATVALVSSASAFMEEGLHRRGDGAGTLCKTPGSLTEAEQEACNPWNDIDATYSFRVPHDQTKSSIHYNVTRALALAAGFQPCAAYVTALFDEGTDVTRKKDELFWAPFPSGLTPVACGDLLDQERVVSARGLAGVRGAWVAPSFTYRAQSTTTDHETNRESLSFHFNPTRSYFQSTGLTVQCSTSDVDPAPLAPNNDLATLDDLYAWATTTGSTALNQCSYTSPGGNPGPITKYNPASDPIAPNQLGAFGAFLHSFQDTYSHDDTMAAGFHTHATGNTDTALINGMVSGHFAGEFGLVGTTTGGGLVTITVNVAGTPTPYDVVRHSDDTVNAINASFSQLITWLGGHASVPAYYKGSPLCTSDHINAFARAVAGISNEDAFNAGGASGGRQRSDLAESLWNNLVTSGTCAW